MGAITRAAANNFTTGGVILPVAINDASVASITDVSQVQGGGGLTLLSTSTASSDNTVDITSGLDSTYDVYYFEFINIKVLTDTAEWGFLLSTDGGSTFSTTCTNATWRSYKDEVGGGGGLGYVDSFHNIQSTGLNNISLNQGNNADDSANGSMYLFDPSSTTYLKHFSSYESNSHDTSNPLIVQNHTIGYANTASAVDAIRFKSSSGSFSGTIKFYGVSNS